MLVGGHAPVGFIYGRPTDAAEQTFGMSRNYADPTFQIFNPPYMYWGKRPVITRVNPNVSTGKVSHGEGRPAERNLSVRMVRNPTVTHLQDGDQRNVELKVVKTLKDAVQVEVPSSNYLPPGPYMLFAHTNSDKGEIPSVSRQVFVDAQLSKTEAAVLAHRAGEQALTELQAGVPAVPAAGDLGESGPSHGPLRNVSDLATVPGPATRSVAGRTRGRRRAVTLVRRAR